MHASTPERCIVGGALFRAYLELPRDFAFVDEVSECNRGAFVATYLGQALGWYRPGQGAGLIGAVVGAVIVLLVYGMVAGRRRPV